MVQVGLDELDSIQPEPARGCRGQSQRLAREIDADDDAIGARQVEAHLPGAASDLDNARVARNRPVEQPRELAALGARAQPGQAVVGRIAGERRLPVETTDGINARPATQPQVGNTVRCVVADGAGSTRPVRRQRALARRAREQVAEGVRYTWIHVG